MRIQQKFIDQASRYNRRTRSLRFTSVEVISFLMPLQCRWRPFLMLLRLICEIRNSETLCCD